MVLVCYFLSTGSFVLAIWLEAAQDRGNEVCPTWAVRCYPAIAGLFGASFTGCIHFYFNLPRVPNVRVAVCDLWARLYNPVDRVGHPGAPPRTGSRDTVESSRNSDNIPFIDSPVPTMDLDDVEEEKRT